MFTEDSKNGEKLISHSWFQNAIENLKIPGYEEVKSFP